MIELILKESLRELTLVPTHAVDTLTHSTQSIGWEALPDQLELEIKLLAMYCHRLSGCEETKCTFHEGKSTLQKIARPTTAWELFIGERRRGVLLRRQQTLDSVSVRLRLCLDSVSVRVLCVGSADQSYTSTILSSSCCCCCLGPPWRRTPEAVHQQPYTRGSSGAAALVVGTACCRAHCSQTRPVGQQRAGQTVEGAGSSKLSDQFWWSLTPDSTTVMRRCCCSVWVVELRCAMETFASCAHEHSRIASVIVSRRDVRSLKEDLSDLNWLQACSYSTTTIPGWIGCFGLNQSCLHSWIGSGLIKNCLGLLWISF